jgi:hypothetical protein
LLGGKKDPGFHFSVASQVGGQRETPGSLNGARLALAAVSMQLSTSDRYIRSE